MRRRDIQGTLVVRDREAPARARQDRDRAQDEHGVRCERDRGSVRREQGAVHADREGLLLVSFHPYPDWEQYMTS